jgi:hypothetical protein
MPDFIEFPGIMPGEIFIITKIEMEVEILVRHYMIKTLAQIDKRPMTKNEIDFLINHHKKHIQQIFPIGFKAFVFKTKATEDTVH